MNEKQRWLLKDLEAWKVTQMERIGRYGPKKEPPAPQAVRAAQVALKRAAAVVSAWEKKKHAGWRSQRDAIQKRADTVRRIILFEKTADALKAVKALSGR